MLAFNPRQCLAILGNTGQGLDMLDTVSGDGIVSPMNKPSVEG